MLLAPVLLSTFQIYGRIHIDHPNNIELRHKKFNLEGFQAAKQLSVAESK